ncbi:MAG: thioredoxin family protein [Methanobacteriaceae archaeon]|nr:thioredoxin family protein [Methanobacteriaceae archaeon]
MNKYFIGLAIILVSFLAVALAFSSLNSDQTRDNTISLQWGSDLNQALQEARTNNKSVFVDFYADWCAYCKEMDEETYRDPQVKEKLSQNYVLVKVNVDGNPDLSLKYKAYSLPTMIILDSEGNEVKRIVGYQNAERLLNQI